MTQTAAPQEWKARRCVVTGAAGFIGSALSSRLRAAGAEVFGLSRREPGAGVVDQWLSCDVTDLAQVRAAMQQARPELVFHLASKVSGARSLDLVLPTLRDNLNGFVHVALTAAELSCQRILCMGSLQEPDREIPAVPSSPYAAAKFAASCYARMLAEVFAVPVVIARPLMVYGPGQLDFTKLVPYVLSRLLRGQGAELTSGRAQFDWVHVDDVTAALLAIAAAPDIVGRTVDIGTGTLVSARDIAEGLAKRVGAGSSLKIGAVADRQREQTRVADVAEAERLTGWRPRIDIERGLDSTVEWFRNYFAAGGSPGGDVSARS